MVIEYTKFKCRLLGEYRPLRKEFSDELLKSFDSGVLITKTKSC